MTDTWEITDAGKICPATYDFVITVKTDNIGTSSDTEFTIPTYPGESYDYNVDCDNDGLEDWTAQTGDVTCSYPSAGTYTIRIKDNSGSGTGFSHIYFNDSGDAEKLLSVDQWGMAYWSSMAHAFEGCTHLSGAASDSPNLSNVSDMSFMFTGASAFNAPIGDWDTSNVTVKSIFSPIMKQVRVRSAVSSFPFGYPLPFMMPA